ncbi:MAG: superoxide dismutase [Opitutales bacterium]
MLVAGPRLFAESPSSEAFRLPSLPYAPDALVPHIDAETMRIHHGRHHAGYTAKLNATLEAAPALRGASIEELMEALAQIDDPDIRTSLRNNGGGYYNHRLFWQVMAPAGETGSPSTALRRALERSFGSLTQFQEAFTRAARSQFGSGWAWLVVRRGELAVTATPNQDNPLMAGIVPDATLGTPILGVDVWEHAYYLKYQNRRTAYLEAWWNVVNWDQVNRLFDEA